MKKLALLLCSVSTLFAKSPVIQSIAVVQNDHLDEELIDASPIAIRIQCDKEKLKASLQPFLDSEVSEKNLQQIKEIIVDHFSAEGDTWVFVKIPEQNITNGRIKFAVMPLTVEEVSVKGNRWFSSSTIERVLGISQGKKVQEKKMLNSVAWLNRNPFINSDIVVSQGHKPGQANVELIVKDRFPVRVYAGTDNTGSSVTGSNRFFSGANFSLGLYNNFTYQFTSAYDFPEFISHFGNWAIFLPWEHELVFYGGYATVHPNIKSFESKGADVQSSMRYAIPFKPLYTQFQHQLLWGADYKQTNSDLFFLGALPTGTVLRIPVNSKRADLFQFYLSYQLEDSWEKLKLTFKIDTFFSPFKFLPHQTKADYNSLRPGADIRYIYGKVATGITYKLPWKMSFGGLLRGQWASAPLLPSEQFALGGYNTVRGYQESIVLADNAVIGNFEIRSPSWSFFRNMDEFLVLAFLDTAYGYNWDPSPAFPLDSWLMGIGAGARYNILPYLTIRLDYGFKVHQVRFANDQIGRVHFSVTASY